MNSSVYTQPQLYKFNGELNCDNAKCHVANCKFYESLKICIIWYAAFMISHMLTLSAFHIYSYVFCKTVWAYIVKAANIVQLCKKMQGETN